MTTIRLFLFDLAGTLVRDDGFTRAVFEDVARGAGLPGPDGAWLKTQMGRRKQAVFAAMLERAGREAEAAVVEDLCGRFETVINERFAREGVHELPGAMDAVRGLEAAGIACGVTTGYPTTTARLIVEALGWTPAVLVASDQVERGRPAPDMIRLGMARAGVDDPRAVGVAGDTPRDLESGLAAGCAVIVGVGHGTHDAAELRGYDGTVVMEDFAGLAATVTGGGRPGGVSRGG